MAGKVVGAFAASHSPGITGWPERAEPAQRKAVESAYEQVRQRLAELRPDAVVAVSVEHFTNFHLGNLPAFAIATGDSYLGPVTEEMGRFLKVEQHRYPGHAALGRHLYEYALRSEFDPSLVEGGLDFDENFCVPFKLIDPESRYSCGTASHRHRAVKSERSPAIIATTWRVSASNATQIHQVHRRRPTKLPISSASRTSLPDLAFSSPGSHGVSSR